MEMPANRIEQLRESRRLSWAELAAVCEVREITIKRWERGESAVPDKQKFRLAEYFEVSAEHLMGWDRTPAETGSAAA